MRPVDWLSEFLRRHQMRFLPFDWPDPGSEEELVYARMWLRVFEENRVTEAEADDASESLAESPPRFRKDHIPAVMRAIRWAREGRRGELAVYDPGSEPEPRRLPIAPPDSPFWKMAEQFDTRLDKHAQ